MGHKDYRKMYYQKKKEAIKKRIKENEKRSVLNLSDTYIKKLLMVTEYSDINDITKEAIKLRRNRIIKQRANQTMGGRYLKVNNEETSL